MTVSETLFDRYLKTRRIRFEIEKGISVHPDRFIYSSKVMIICEVKQLEGKLPVGYLFNVGNPYKRLRNAIKRKVRQGKEAKTGKTPYVVVLFNYGSPQIMTNEIVEAAMYGDIAIVIDLPADPKVKGKVRGSFFSGNGLLRHARSHNEPGKPFNQRISAVSILDVINPTDKVLTLEYNKATEGISTQEIDKRLKILNEISEKLERKGKYKKNLQAPRLRVFHNFYADNPLSFDVFNGAFDEQYFIDPITGKSRRY